MINPIENRLLRPAIKKLPGKLIWIRDCVPPIGEPYTEYRMFQKNGMFLGLMSGFPEKLSSGYPKSLIGELSYYIEVLRSNYKNIGIGKSFINIAKQLSYEKNCKGRIHVVAAILDEKEMVHPEIFYRKMGFLSTQTDHLNIIDKAISNGKRNLKVHKDWSTLMIYDPKNKPDLYREPQSKIKNFLINLYKKDR